MTSGPPSKRDLRQEITDQIIRALEQGTAPWQKPWQAGALELPFNPATGKPYRGGNVIQLMIEASSHGYDDPRWLTYRQAQENGWQVRRGEKSTHVEFWQFPDRTAKPSSEGKSSVAEAQRDSFIYRVYTVFNAKQIDGIPPHSPRVRQEWEVLQSAQAILDSSGARIQHDQSDRAFYSRSADTIHLPPKAAFKTAGEYFGTALHEASHWSGHPARLNRETLNESYRFGDLNYAREELRAELASVFLLAERGIPHNADTHAAYLNSWLEKWRARHFSSNHQQLIMSRSPWDSRCRAAARDCLLHIISPFLKAYRARRVRLHRASIAVTCWFWMKLRGAQAPFAWCPDWPAHSGWWCRG